MHDKRLILYTIAACWWPEVAKKGRIVQLKMKWHNKTGFVPHSHINESRNVGFRVKIESTNNDTFRLLVGKCNDNTPSTPGARKFCQLANNISTRDLNLIFFVLSHSNGLRYLYLFNRLCQARSKLVPNHFTLHILFD